MFSFFLVLLLFFFAFINKNTFLAFVFLPSIFFYFLAYELRKSPFVSSYFDFAVVSDYSLYLLVGFYLIISTLLAFSKIPKLSLGFVDDYSVEQSSEISSLSFLKLSKMYYIISFVSLISFVINFNRVNFDISLLFLFPRRYEEIFGESTLVNYLYFLNIPALCLSIFASHNNNKIRFSSWINFFLVFISFFHGIKFTVFDTLLIPAFFYYHLTFGSAKTFARLFYALFFLLLFYLSFSFFVRGSSKDNFSIVVSILDYILPNYYNLAYSFQVTPLQFDPISPILPDKVPNPFLSLFFQGEFGFLLNDKFNMPTAFNVYHGLVPFFSTIFLLPVIVFLRNRIMLANKNYPRLSLFFILAYIDFCLFFSWYFFAFNKTKYVYYVFIFLLINHLLYSRSNKLSISSSN